VEIRAKTQVTGYDGSRVAVGLGEPIAASTLIWTAGVAPSPVLAGLPCRKEKGRVAVNEFLESSDLPGLWAVGDCAAVLDQRTGRLQPPTAQHALRQARHVAKNIEAVLAGQQKKSFRFSTLGQLASIGHRHGVANILGVNFSGFVAWLLWRSIYLLKLPRAAKKTRVALSWLLEMIFSKDLEQMLTLRDVELISRIATSLRTNVAD
jgi:NADH dehydrogenase